MKKNHSQDSSQPNSRIYIVADRHCLQAISLFYENIFSQSVIQEYFLFLSKGIYDVPPSVMSRSFEDFGLVAPDVRRSLKCKSASDLDRGHRPPPVDRTTRPTMMNRNTWGNTADIYDCPPRLDERRSADYSHSTLNDQVSGLSGRFENMSMKGTGPKRNSGESGFFESSNGSLPEAEQLYSNRPMVSIRSCLITIK